MGKIFYITGGAFSGKSAFAENIANKFDQLGIMVVGGGSDTKAETAEKKSPTRWERIDVTCNFDRVLTEGSHDLFVLDSLAALVRQRIKSRFVDSSTITLEAMREVSENISREVMNMVVAAKENGRNLLVISSEVGMGIVPEDDTTRFFRAETGRVNQLMASLADEGYMLVSGIPIKIKG